MPSRTQFSTDDSVKIVAWWYELKDIHKVHCDTTPRTKTLNWTFPEEAAEQESLLACYQQIQEDLQCQDGVVKVTREETCDREWRKHWKGEKPGHLSCWNVNQSDINWDKSFKVIRRSKPKTLEDLMEVVNTFVASLDEAEVRRAVRAVRLRAEICIKMGGSHFESKLEKYKRGSI